MTLNESIKQLLEMYSDKTMPSYFKFDIAKIINTLLTDAQEVRHGHWVGDFCSICGKDALCDCDKYEIYGTIHSSYCPHCGAKMDEVCDERI